MHVSAPVIGPQFDWGDRLRKVRRTIAKLSQTDMATLVGTQQATYSKWENGTVPAIPVAQRVSEILEREFPGEVSAVWLLMGYAPFQQVEAAERPWLPRMDSNHQPPDYWFDAGQSGGSDFHNMGVSYLGHSSPEPGHTPVSITLVDRTSTFGAACRGTQ